MKGFSSLRERTVRSNPNVRHPPSRCQAVRVSVAGGPGPCRCDAAVGVSVLWRPAAQRLLRPQAARFLGRKVYLSAMVVLLTAMRQGPTPRRLGALRGMFGADRRTLTRWRTWWQVIFPSTAFWRRCKARFMPPVADSDLPGSLVDRFCGDSLRQRMVRILRFLSGLPTAS